jgi:hypothetical protein
MRSSPPNRSLVGLLDGDAILDCPGVLTHAGDLPGYLLAGVTAGDLEWVSQRGNGGALDGLTEDYVWVTLGT